MSKHKQSTSKQRLKSTLQFFSSSLSDLNNKRIQVNRAKGLAKYFASSQKSMRALSPLDTSLGIMSFSLYMLRLSTNIGLLVQLNWVESKEQTDYKLRRELFYSLLNDSLWCAVNLTQFFWLSYRNSISSGLRGMQLETLAQLIDIFIMIIRYKQEKDEYELKYNQATGIERTRLAIEWQNKEFNTLRSLLTSLAIVTVFALFSFSIITVPLSPLISTIVLISSLLRVITEVKKNHKLINQLKLNEVSSQQIMNEELAKTRAHLKDLNQVILSSVFLPLGLFLLFTTPIPVVLLACVSMLLIHCLLTSLIDTKFSPLNTLNNEKNSMNTPDIPSSNSNPDFVEKNGYSVGYTT
ncbi:hypothetical protein Lnau_0835 [Legionella nautarum]|uniref:Coiled-coil protein n=1 Tax=Legionella nautarum TaxID=45070 RepID=A0A0W0WU56_9GAMM|nr:hypothetical protein [Legionella nautarum]KTD35851.1 hypothetical protein Lnau_0835 [Legionella nautarum]